MTISSDELLVAFYQNEKDNQPVQVSLTWDLLVQTLSAAETSPCTVENCQGKKCPYKHTSTEGRENAWSPVEITGERDNDNVRAVTALVLDGDGITKDQLVRTHAAVKNLCFAVHTTHRHRQGDHYFIRLVIRLSRPVLAAEWAKFYPASLASLGLQDVFDPTCKDLSRLYFLPTHPKDAPFLQDAGQGEPLNVDGVLSHTFSKIDPALAHVLPRATPPQAPEDYEDEVAHDASQNKFTDLGKIVAMLSSYRMSRSHGKDADKERADLIGRLLSGSALAAPGSNAASTPIQPPADLPKGRGYALMRVARICTGYLPADTPDEIYLQLFARSIDAMCFGRREDRAEMEEHLLEKLRIGRAKRAEFDAESEARHTAGKAFAITAALERQKQRQASQIQNTPNTPGRVLEEVLEQVEPDSWMTELQMKKDGEGLVACGLNAYLILKNHEDVRGCFRWNDVALRIETVGVFADIEAEVIDTRVGNYLTQKWGMKLPANEIYKIILMLAYENRFDPIKDYLHSLTWDGVSRIDANDGWLSVYANAEKTEDDEGFVQAVGRKWLVAAVARGLNPGCKVDNVLVIEGGQGKRKSTLFEVLGAQWYADMAIVIGDKDSKMIANRSWICEIPDLAALKKTSEVNAIKAFFSQRIDTYRPPFARAPIQSPRRNVFAGTTNEEQYLGDPTGNRRFWCVSCGQIDLAAVIRDRDQLWAEAVVMYYKHVNECPDKLECGCWWMTREESHRASKRVDERVQDSPYKEGIDQWWNDLSPDKRPKAVTTYTVALEALGYMHSQVTHYVLTEIGHALKKIGFSRTRVRENGERKRVYVPSEELLKRPQSEKGKHKFTSFKAAMQANVKPN